MERYIIQPGSPRDRTYLPLATKQGKIIRNERRRELAPETLRASVEKWDRIWPEARLRSISGTYNCGGLVFASRRTWINTEDLEWISEDDGYYKVVRQDQLRPGDLVVYRDQGEKITHIGMILASEPKIETASWEITVLSKWGAEGEYRHPLTHVPSAYGRPSDYWSERRES